MPIRRVPNHEDLEYLLICHDADGREIPEAEGLLSKNAVDAVRNGGVTDVFMISHGWKGDVPAAIEQYDRWIGAMASCKEDRMQIRSQNPKFKALLLGLHWPSLPWGDEELPGPEAAFDTASSVMAKLVDDYADRIANTAAAREAITVILESALDNMAPPTLPTEVHEAYLVLNREASIGSDGEGAAPGMDREPFDPERAYQNERQDVSFGGPVSAGILSVLRQLSFWKMKDRARRFGETGGYMLLRALQDAADAGGANIRVHLMGHSFGCIVMSSLLAGPDGSGELKRPIDSLFLVQGALSLWSFCNSIPRVPDRTGYFRSVVADRKVAGPIVITMSEYDTAVRKYYPLGAGIAGQVEFAPAQLPKYGGVGVFGIRGPGIEIVDKDVGDLEQKYDFQAGVIYNLDAANYIKKMDGASGAHNDIAHPEVAHAFWQAVIGTKQILRGENKLSEQDGIINPDKVGFNGIDAITGGYVTSPLSPRQIARLAANEPLDAEEQAELKRKWFSAREKHFGTIADDAQDLGKTGWGIVFAPGVGDDVKEALKPLLELRREQAGDYYHDFKGNRAFQANDTKRSFLARSRAGAGPSNPRLVPYYLLLVGSPDGIPFKVQHQLDVQYAVGRLHFNTLEEYANYAATVVAAEKGSLRRPRNVTLFGVRNRGDVATQLSADQLVSPLFDSLSNGNKDWITNRLIGPECTRSALIDLLQADAAPALLFSASHGLGFPNGHSRQLAQQGALLCQDWPGPLRHQGPIPDDFYVAADHLPKDAHCEGLITFFFACYGGGTPQTDDYAHLVEGPQAQIAPYPFVAPLPQALLGRPRGALATIGHVERAWSYSFLSGQAGPQLEVFEAALLALMQGQRVGAAMEWFNSRYAELSSDLTVEIEARRARPPRPEEQTLEEDRELASMWTANNDARSYVVIGDPAVRLAVS